MNIRFARLNRDDDRFKLKAGDLVLVDTDYDNPDKVVGIFRLPPTLLGCAFYRSSLDMLDYYEDICGLDQE